MVGKWLSATEKDYLAALRQQWLRDQTHTAPCNRRRAEAAIADLYRYTGESAPQFLWVESPRAAVAVLGPQRKDQEAQHGRSLTDQFSSFDCLWDLERVPDGLNEEVRAEFRAHEPGVYRQIRGRVLEDLSHALVEGRLGCDLSLLCRVFLRSAGRFPYFEGCAGWLNSRTEIGRCGVWWWPHQRACVVADRPKAIHCDAAGRLHHASEPAVQYRDGYALTLWHGTLVPEDWITKAKDLDPALALTWHNAEQRRAAGEIVGWARVLDRFAARTVDKDTDPQIGELVEVWLPGGGAARFLKVRCGTGRKFVLSVPGGMRTAREANAWTYGLEADDYRPEVRT